MVTAIFIIMALIIIVLGCYILFQKAKKEEATAHIMQPRQYNYYGMPTRDTNYCRSLNSTNEPVNNNPNTNKIKIEIEQTNQDQNQIQIKIDPKAKNNTVDTSIKNNPRLTHYQQKLIDNSAHRPTVNRNNTINRQKFGNNTINHNSDHNFKQQQLFTPNNKKQNQITPAHKPAQTKSNNTLAKKEKLYTPKSRIDKPILPKLTPQQQKIIQSLNAKKEKVIKKENKTASTRKSKNVNKVAQKHKSILEQYQDKATIKIKDKK